MAGHAQLKFVMTECSKTQIRLTGLKWEMRSPYKTLIVTGFVSAFYHKNYNNYDHEEEKMIKTNQQQMQTQTKEATKPPFDNNETVSRNEESMLRNIFTQLNTCKLKLEQVPRGAQIRPAGDII